MKQFLYAILKFSFVSIVIYCCLIFVWGSFIPLQVLKKNLNYKLGGYGHLFTRLDEAKNTKDVDILILGSSHAYRGFDTRIFKTGGYSIFNFGSSAQTPIQTNHYVSKFLDQFNPKLVIYEVYPSTFVSDGIEATLDFIANDDYLMSNFLFASQFKNIKVYNTLLYASMYELIHDKSKFIEPVKRKKDTYIPGGYVQSDLSYYTPVMMPKTKWQFNEKQFEAFNVFLALLKDKNIEILLVQAPITKVKYESYSNNSDFDNRMKKLGNYINFNPILSEKLSDSLHFYDAHHLNQNGVNIFNKAMLEKLKELAFVTK